LHLFQKTLKWLSIKLFNGLSRNLENKQKAEIDAVKGSFFSIKICILNDNTCNYRIYMIFCRFEFCI